MLIQIDIERQGKLRVIEEDIMVALKEAGLHPGDAEIESFEEPDDDDAFVVYMPGRFSVDCPRLKAIIEADTSAIVAVTLSRDPYDDEAAIAVRKEIIGGPAIDDVLESQRYGI